MVLTEALTQVNAVVITENRCVVSIMLLCHKCSTAPELRYQNKINSPVPGACTPCTVWGRLKLDLVTLKVVLMTLMA